MADTLPEPQETILPPPTTLRESRARLEKAAVLLGRTEGELERAWYAYMLAVLDGQPGDAARVRVCARLFRQALADTRNMERDLTSRILRLTPPRLGAG